MVGDSAVRRVALVFGYVLLPATVSGGVLLLTNRDTAILQLGSPRYFIEIPVVVVVAPSIFLRPNAWRALALSLSDYLGLLGGVLAFSSRAVGSGGDTATLLFFTLLLGAPLGIAMLFGLSVMASRGSKRIFDHQKSGESHGPA